MAAIEVRAARETDWEFLAGLYLATRNFHAQHYPHHFKPAADAGEAGSAFGEALSDPLQAVAAAELEGAVAGYAWFEIRTEEETPFTHAAFCLYVRHLAVAQEARRKGVATALMRSGVSLAAKQGMLEIALDSWACNGEALAFFAAEGFKPVTIYQRREL